MKKVYEHFLLPLVGIALMLGLWAAASAMAPDLPSPPENLGGQQDLHSEPLGKARRNGPRDSAHGFVFAVARRERLLPGAAARNAARLFARYVESSAAHVSIPLFKCCGPSRHSPGCPWDL